MRDKFMFFDNFKETADKLPDDLRLKFYDAMTDYVFKGIEPDDAVISAIITAIKPSLDKEDRRGGVREGAGAPKNNQNASKVDDEIIKNNQNNQNQSKQSILSETETETEDNITPKNKISNEIIVLSPYKGNELCSCGCKRRAKFDINGKKFCGQHTRIELSEMGRLDLLPERERFQKPSLEEVQAYCLERKNNVDAERFVDFYECKGWKVGKNPMKDWRAAVRNWERGSYSADASRKTADDEEFWAKIRQEAKEYEQRAI